MTMKYKIGDKLILVTHHGSQYPVEVTGFTSLPDDLVVRWMGVRPLSALSAHNGQSTICTKELKEVRYNEQS